MHVFWHKLQCEYLIEWYRIVSLVTLFNNSFIISL